MFVDLAVTDRVIFAATAAGNDFNFLSNRMSGTLAAHVTGFTGTTPRNHVNILAQGMPRRVHATVITRLVIGTTTTAGNDIDFLSNRMSGAFTANATFRVIGAMAGERGCCEAQSEDG